MFAVAVSPFDVYETLLVSVRLLVAEILRFSTPFLLLKSTPKLKPRRVEEQSSFDTFDEMLTEGLTVAPSPTELEKLAPTETLSESANDAPKEGMNVNPS